VIVERVLVAGGTLSRRPSVLGWLFRGAVASVLVSTLAWLLLA
jgi:hypothetical protein